MATRLKTYRVDEGLDAAVMARAAERGESVTAVIVRALEAYIRESAVTPVYTPPVVYTPAVEAVVYTPPPSPRPEPAVDLEDEPRRPCPGGRHPSDQIDGLGMCRVCMTEVDF